MARELTPLLGLIAAGALLIDYVMTVAVSTSSALDQLSRSPRARSAGEIGIAVRCLITLGNLRGLRESGNIFAVPTYVFVVLALLIVGFGVYQMVSRQAVIRDPPADARQSARTR